MKRCAALLLATAAGMLALAGRATAQAARRPVAAVRRPIAGVAGAHATPEDIELAIQRAQAYLLAQQQPDGSFERVTANGVAIAQAGQVGGASALVTYALLTSGLPSSENHVAQAIAYLRSVDMEGTYALGLRCQVWYQLSLELDANERRPSAARRDLERLVEHDAQLLLGGVNRAGQAAGMY